MSQYIGVLGWLVVSFGFLDGFFVGLWCVLFCYLLDGVVVGFVWLF